MAKRQRAVRPGQRKYNTRSVPAKSPTPASVPAPAATVTASEEARAAELEAEIVADQRSAEAAASGSRSRRGTGDASRTRPREAGTLASRATTEYAYVVSDLRRIVLVAGGLLLAMLGIWLLIAGSGFLKI
jgi:hypothetical protein